MQATQEPGPPTGDTLHIGMRVINYRRGNAIGVVKSEPFRDASSGDRRWWVWVDYTESTGVVAIDAVRELHVVKDPK